MIIRNTGAKCVEITKIFRGTMNMAGLFREFNGPWFVLTYRVNE